MDTLRNGLRGHIDGFFNRRNFNVTQLLPANLTKRQLLLVIPVRYQAAHFFERLMIRLGIRLMADTSGDRCLGALAILQNIVEERGRGNPKYGPAHFKGRIAFFNGLELDYVTWEAQLGDNLDDLSGLEEPIRGLIQYYLDLIDNDPIAALAAMCYWEARIWRLDYAALLVFLRKYYPEFEEPGEVLAQDTPIEQHPILWHIISHLRHDKYHEQDIVDALIASIYTEDEVRRALDGLEGSDIAWNVMWEGIMRMISSK